MILVDTSIWVDHLRGGDAGLVDLLERAQVLAHAFVLGELACGNLCNRREILALLGQLPQAPLADDAEVLFFIEQNCLMGSGIGYLDAHLLAATALAPSVRLWTRDQHLAAAAGNLNLAYAG